MRTKIIAILGALSLVASVPAYVLASGGGGGSGGASFSTSAGLASLLSDETGTGAACFATSPTFTTSAIFGADAATGPTGGLVRAGNATGGTANIAGGNLTLQSGRSTGNGTSSIILQTTAVGASGATGVNAASTIATITPTAVTWGGQTHALGTNGGITAGASNGITISGSGSNITLSNGVYLQLGEGTSFINWAGTTGNNKNAAPDNLAEALWLGQGANRYLTLVTTDGAEMVVFAKPFRGTLAAPVAATGTTGSDCAAIPAGTVWQTVTAANAAKGVCLPTTTSVTTCVRIMNQVVASVLKVYGAAADSSPTVNGAASYSQAGGVPVDYCNSGVAWTSY